MQVDEDHKHALVGDAFGDDKKNLEAGGLSLKEQHHFLDDLSLGKIPDVCLLYTSPRPRDNR